jgi:small-conductance mechanosensitive channel
VNSHVPEFLQKVYLGNSLLNWLLAVGIVTGVMLLFPVIGAWLHRGRNRLLGNKHPVVQLLSLLVDRTLSLVRVSLALYLGQHFLEFPPKVDRVFDFVIIVGAWLQVAVWASVALRYLVEHRQHADLDGDGRPEPSPAVNVMMVIGQVLIWAVVSLFALSNLGINITALVAGLGVGGIAVALAVQTILGDLLSSMSIAFDKPFVVGDRLRIDHLEGTVERIGMRSTRLRSVTGEQITLANGDILKSRVHNLSRMSERRVQSRLYIQYESGPEQVRLVSQLAEEAVRAQDHTRFVSCLLAELGTYALEFELTYFIATSPDVEPPRIIDAVNRGIFERLAKAGVHMAYPAARRIST